VDTNGARCHENASSWARSATRRECMTAWTLLLLTDYLKAITMNQNVPADLLQHSTESRFFNQYCRGQTLGCIGRTSSVGPTSRTRS
jgi:hypothetical protein